MIACINKQSPKYQNLKKFSGTSENLLDASCTTFLEKFNRFPRFDELIQSNTEPEVRNELKVTKGNTVDLQYILDYTGKNTIEEAVQFLNNKFNDLEIDISPIVERGLITIKKRPTSAYKEVERNEINANSKYNEFITDGLDKLQSLYGIKINYINDTELSKPEWNDLIPRDKLTKAFIYNGEIYINVDKYSQDSYIHEMMHLLVGSMRFTNPQMYQNLINSVENFELYPSMLQEYEGKSRNDVKEEIFVTQIGKYLSGMDSVVTNLSEEQLYEIQYNIIRTLDSMLMGDFSAKIVDDLYHQTFRDVVEITNSDILTSKFDALSAETHRKLNNLKSDLLKKNELIEICD